MNRYAVFGLGRMGEAIVYDLLQNDSDCVVHGLEYSEEVLNMISVKYSEYVNTGRLCLDQVDVSSLDEHQISKYLEDINVTFGAIDYSFNYKLTKACINAISSFLDLGGNPTVVREQRKLQKLALETNVTIIPDCGLAPGMADVLAKIKIDEIGDVEECHIRVGGLPQDPKTQLKYQQVFSIRGLTNEYLEDAIVLRDGKITTVPSLTEVEELSFPEPYGKLEAFQTAGGTSSLPEIYEGKVNELTYKTIRYPGHVQYFQFLKEFGLLSSGQIEKYAIDPRKVVEYCLELTLPQNEPDVVLVKIRIVNKKSKVFEWVIIDKEDKKTGFSAMARTTAFPISILGQMIANGKITERGVVAGETVTPPDEFIKELKKRDIVLNEYKE